MRAVTACLFGGTLFAAGIAHAQEFHFKSNAGGAYPVSYGYCYGADLPGIGSYDLDVDVNYSPSSPFFNVNANYNGFGGNAHLNSTSLGANAFASSFGGVGHGFAIAYAYFSVTASAQLEIVWDFVDEQPPFTFADSKLIIVDWTHGGVVVFEVDQGDPASGTMMLDVSPGTYYGARLYTVAYESNGRSSASMTLAAPACPCDLDANGVLNLDDIDAFAVAFIGGNLDADLDANGTLNLDDIAAFAGCFIGGCP